MHTKYEQCTFLWWHLQIICLSKDMTLRRFIFAFTAVVSITVVRAQEVSGYGYLELPVSARGLALGGTSISVVEPDLSLAEQNPALLCPQMEKQAVLAYTNYLAGIQMGYAAYAGRFMEVGGWSAGMRFVDYGHFDGYDTQGLPTGSFSVKDMCLEGAIGYPLNDRWNIGAQMKFLYTSYESYNAFAMGVDLGLNYYDDASGNSFSLTVTNLGGQFKSLYEESKQKMPTQVNLGWSRELLHLPLCVSVTAYHLLDWDHGYVDGNGQKQTFSGAEQVLNHLIFGVEWTASQNFWLAASYNYRHQRRFSGQGGFLRGVALGAGLSFRSYSFQMGYASTNLADGTMTFQLGYTF